MDDTEAEVDSEGQKAVGFTGAEAEVAGPKLSRSIAVRQNRQFQSQRLKAGGVTRAETQRAGWEQNRSLSGKQAEEKSLESHEYTDVTIAGTLRLFVI